MVEAAFGALLHSIVTVQLPPGAPLRDAKVAQQMGISRAPVREACRRLEERGLIVAIANRGFFVRSFTPQDIANIFEVRAALELTALQKSIRSLTTHQLATLVEPCDALEVSVARGRANELPDRVIEIHRSICRLSMNSVLIEHFNALAHHIVMLMRWMGLVYSNAPDVVLRNRRLVDVIASRDPERASNELSLYLLHTRDRTLEHFEQSQGRSDVPD